jgi:3-oxoacyl-[acyl-carrier-protein] synthase III
MPGIRSIGWYVPGARRFAPELAAEAGTPLHAVERFGLVSRAEPGAKDHPASMGARAVAFALEVAGLTIDDVDLLVFCGMTRDFPSPWVGAFGVLFELRGSKTAGFDLSNRCAAIHEALWLAATVIEARRYKRIVVCSADRFDYLFDPMQPGRSPSDLAYSAGAAAAVIDGEAQNEIVAYSGYTNPDLSVHTMNVPLFGGSREWITEDSITSGLYRQRKVINLDQSRALLEYLAAADARNIPAVAQAAGFDEIDFAIASPLDVRAQLASFEALGIPEHKTFFLLSLLGHMGPADSLINLGAATATMKIGRRIVMSTRSATFSNAIALRATGETLGIRVKGEGISQSELDACMADSAESFGT